MRVSVERKHGGASLLDVLDRVLDKGIVLTPEVPRDRIDLRDEAVRIVGSIDTYLSYSEAVGQVAPSVPKLDDDFPVEPDPGGGGEPETGSGGAASFAGTANVLPRIPPARHRRPID